MGRTIRMEKIRMKKAIHTILHSLSKSTFTGGSGQEIRTCKLSSEPLPYLTKVLPHHYKSMLYGPNLLNKFAVPYVCLYHVYVPAVHSCPNKLYNIHHSKRTIRTRAISVEWWYVRYESITYHTSYITYHPGPSLPNVLLRILNNPKNGYSGINIAESAIPHRIFWLQWNMVYKLTRETKIGGMFLDSGRLYWSSLRVHSSSGWYVKIHTNCTADSECPAYESSQYIMCWCIFSDCNYAGPTHT